MKIYRLGEESRPSVISAAGDSTKNVYARAPSKGFLGKTRRYTVENFRNDECGIGARNGNNAYGKPSERLQLQDLPYFSTAAGA